MQYKKYELSEVFRFGEANTDDHRALEALLMAHIKLNRTCVNELIDKVESEKIMDLILNSTMAYVGYILKEMYEALESKDDLIPISEMMKNHIDEYVKSFKEY